MPRLENTGNTDFLRYLGPPHLQPKKVDWQGDPQKRLLSGAQILSPRARQLNHIAMNRLDPEAQTKVTEPAEIKRHVNDMGLAKINLPAQSRMWAS
jgi:hypothetical protein